MSRRLCQHEANMAQQKKKREAKKKVEPVEPVEPVESVESVKHAPSPPLRQQVMANVARPLHAMRRGPPPLTGQCEGGRGGGQREALQAVPRRAPGWGWG